ncbi:MAG TPA: hypothetical protein GXX20_04750 [Clostridiaceae bacterium]|nr:hypothetical protein [Clostridiaceae bacterium]
MSKSNKFMSTNTSSNNDVYTSSHPYVNTNIITKNHNAFINRVDNLRNNIKKLIIILLVIFLICPSVPVGSAYNSSYFNIPDNSYTIVKGIVEENNPDLGYITLYNEDGTGITDSYQRPWVLRTYNYIDPDEIEVFRNNAEASIYDIEAGDTVFIMLGNDGTLLSISAASNYILKYGKVISKRASYLAVELDDGTQQDFELDSRVLVIESGMLTDINSLKSGDRVKLLLQVTDKKTIIKEITISARGLNISNVYKGVIYKVDQVLNKLILRNVQVLQRDSWKRIEQKGFVSMKLSDEFKSFYNNQLVSLDKINSNLRNNEVYVAAGKDFGNDEKAVLVSFRKKDDKEVLYNDEITRFSPNFTRVFLKLRSGSIGISEETIIVDNGKLVPAGAARINEKAYIVANRDYRTGNYNAGIIYINDRYNEYMPQIYRGRIKSIEEEESITLYTFSQLKGLDWEYYNTPKTFNITYDTRILGEEGIIRTEDFVGYGDESYVDKVVYIVADGVDSILISTAPYGTINVRGEIYKIERAQNEQGVPTEEVTEISIKNAKVYSSDTYLWESKDLIDLSLLKNTVIIKNNKVVDSSQLKKGDIIRAVKKDVTRDGDAYIIIVEE